MDMAQINRASALERL